MGPLDRFRKSIRLHYFNYFLLNFNYEKNKKHTFYSKREGRKRGKEMKMGRKREREREMEMVMERERER